MGIERKTITCVVNGQRQIIEVSGGETLLEMLRDQLGLTGIKKDCETGECGACTVLVDHIPIVACHYLAVWVDGKEILTVEGPAKDDELSGNRKGLMGMGAVPGEYCLPGSILTADNLLRKSPTPPDERKKQDSAASFASRLLK